jgi:hypothetical protein
VVAGSDHIMRLITVTDDDTGDTVQREVSRGELATLSGVELDALLFPNPTVNEAAAISRFLDRYRAGAA